MSILDKMVMRVDHRGLVPAALRRFLGRHTNMLLDLRTARWRAEDPYAQEPPFSSYAPRYPYTLGIVADFWHQHHHYVAACREMGVAYKVLDLSGPDWLQVVEESDCDAFLVRPSVALSIWKQMYDERLRVMAEDLGKVLFPSYQEIWLYESKRRMQYWCAAHQIPHPRTWVFYDRKQALACAAQVPLPVVYKSNLGSGASGVRVFRTRGVLRRHIHRCFLRGFTTYRRCRNDKEWGFVFLQEYLPEAREWRIIRIGDSYFGYEKLKKGDYHSGSLLRRYGELPTELLSFARDVLDVGGFQSMDLDIFQTRDGRYLVNELQTIFGMSRPEMCVVDGQAGRMLYEPESDAWTFEAGDFCRNHLCNLRVQTWLDVLAGRLTVAGSAASE